MLRRLLGNILRSPDAQPAPTGGSNGAGSPAAAQGNPRDVLAALLAQQNSPASPEPQESASPAAQADPEEPTPPEATDEPGQDNLPPEETPQTEGDEPKVEGGPENEDSPAEETPPPEKPNAVQKRIDALTRQKSELQTKVEELTTQLEEAKADGAHGVTRPTVSLPANVAKLKTVAECEARLQTAQASMETIQDFLDANPGDASTEYDMGGDKKVTRHELIESRKAWRDELKAIPQHAQGIAQQTQFAQTQRATRQEVLTSFPELADAEHPTTKAVQQKIKDAPFLKSFASPEFAGKIWVDGETVSNAQLAARKANRTAEFDAAMKTLRSLAAPKDRAGSSLPAAGAHGVTRPTGTVPARKPMTAGGAAARPNGNGVEAALKSHGETGSRSSFAALLAARNAPASK